MEVVVDPDGLVPELREENNAVVRALVADLPYRTQGYSYDRVTLLGVEPSTRFEVRDAVGRLLRRGEVGRDEAVDVAGLGAGQVVSAAADRPFVAVMGSAYLASGYHVRDAGGEGLATRHVTTLSRSKNAAHGDAEEIDRLVLHAPAATRATVSDLDDGRVLAEVDLGAGETRAVDAQTHPDRLVARVLVEADPPVLAWAYADVGFVFAAPDGRLAGTELVGFVGRSSARLGNRDSEEVLLWSFADENRVLLERSDTGAVLWEGLLPRYAVRSVAVPFPAHDGEVVPLRVRASGAAAAANAVLRKAAAYGYVHGFYVPAERGRVVGQRFLVPLTPNGRGGEDDAVVFSFYDETGIEVRDPDTGEALVRRVLRRAEHLDLAEAIAAPAGGERRRLVVESDRPVSVYAGLGAASASFMPLLFAQPPDLVWRALRTEPEAPAPGDVVTVAAELHNVGAQRARRVAWAVYDGDPREGRLLRAGDVGRLDAGRPAEVRFELGVAEGERRLVFVADPEALVDEADEENNRAELGLANPPDLSPVTIEAGAPVAGRAGEVGVAARNLGGRPVEGASIRLWADEELVGTALVDVSALGEVAVRIPWRPSGPGAVALRAEVSAEVTEARLDNNALTADVAVAAAPFEPEVYAEVRPRSPGPCDDVELRVRVTPPAPVSLHLDGELLGEAPAQDVPVTLRWPGEKAVGLHPLLLRAGETAVEVPVEVRRYPYALAVESAPVERGRVLVLNVVPAAPLPPGATLRAEGFEAEGLALRRRAALPAGEHRVLVRAADAGGNLACAPHVYEVTEPAASVRLTARPAVAGPGEPVTLTAEVRGVGGPAQLTIAIDGEARASFDVLGEARLGAVSVEDGAGEHVARATLTFADVEVAGERRVPTGRGRRPRAPGAGGGGAGGGAARGAGDPGGAGQPDGRADPRGAPGPGADGRPPAGRAGRAAAPGGRGGRRRPAGGGHSRDAPPRPGRTPARRPRRGVGGAAPGGDERSALAGRRPRRPAPGSGRGGSGRGGSGGGGSGRARPGSRRGSRRDAGRRGARRCAARRPGGRRLVGRPGHPRA